MAAVQSLSQIQISFSQRHLLERRPETERLAPLLRIPQLCGAYSGVSSALSIGLPAQL